MDQTFNYTRRLRRLRTTAVQGSFIAGSVFCGLLFFNPTAEEGTHLAWVKVRHVCVLNMVRSFYSNCVVLFFSTSTFARRWQLSLAVLSVL